MTLVSLTVRRERTKLGRGTNHASVVRVVDDTRIIQAIPSVCKKDGISDGLVNSVVEVDNENGPDILYLWVTQDVTAIAALT